MEKYELYLMNETNSEVSLGIVNSPRVPIEGEEIPMQLSRKAFEEALLKEGIHSQERILQYYEEEFNKGFYLVETVKHIIRPSKKVEGGLEAKIEVYAKRK